jgi:hypothetical protein
MSCNNKWELNLIFLMLRQPFSSLCRLLALTMMDRFCSYIRLAAPLVVLSVVLVGTPSALAQTASSSDEVVPTTVTVHVRSNDAKLLQDPVGGARVTIRNAATGAVLAEGMQRGSSGSTDQIMRQPHRRGKDIYTTPDAAQYVATLQLSEPTRVEVTAEAPLDYPQAMQSASKTLWLMPGQDIAGDGIVLTVHGFIVEVLSPSEADAAPGETLTVQSRVRMLCGCPTEPGGMWDASTYTITAQLLREGQVVAAAPMQFAGTTSEYEAALTVPASGATAVRVLAMDAARVNFGLATHALAGEATVGR